MINACVHVLTSWGKCPIDNYSQRYLALLILGSRLNTMNAPYCNHQPFKKKCETNETTKIWRHKIFLSKLFLTWKSPNLGLDITMTSQWHRYNLVLGKVRRLEYCFRDAQFVLLVDDNIIDHHWQLNLKCLNSATKLPSDSVAQLVRAW